VLVLLRGAQAAKFATEAAEVAVKKAEAEWREAKANLDATNADVSFKQSLIEVARKDRDLAEARASYTRIAAPFDGVIIKRSVDPGDFVQNATTGSPEPFLTVAKEKTQVLGDVYSAIAPRFEISAWFATAEWVAKNRAAARAFAQAMHESAAWANQSTNRPRSAEILAKYRKLDPALLSRMTRATYGDTYDPALAQPLLDAAFKYHSIPRPESARDLSA